MKKNPWGVIILSAVAVLVVCALISRWPALPRQVPFQMEHVTSALALIFFCSLLIERTIEVLFTIWRAEEANRLERTVRTMVQTKTTGPRFQQAQDALIAFRSTTQRMALPTAFGFGLMIAGLGVRVIEPFFATAGIDERQLGIMRFADIVFTAALLAGGSDPIHKILDAFRKFMEATSGKAAGTTPPPSTSQPPPNPLGFQVDKIIKHVASGVSPAEVVDGAKLKTLAQGIAALDTAWLSQHSGQPVAGLRNALLTLDKAEVPQLFAKVP